MRIPLVTVALLLVACAPPQDVGGEEPSVTAAQDKQEQISLAGHWRVAGLDGEPLNGAYGIALVADDTRVWWEPPCSGQRVAYTIDGVRFAARDPDPPNSVVCDIGFPDELPQVWAAMIAADRIERTPENGILISGNGRSVTLFSQ